MSIKEDTEDWASLLGARVLLSSTDSSFYSEAWVLEVSEKGRVKFRFPKNRGFDVWCEPNKFDLVEILPPAPAQKLVEPRGSSSSICTLRKLLFRSKKYGVFSSQTAFAGLVGCSHSLVSKVESSGGAVPVSAKLAKLTSAATGADPGWLIEPDTDAVRSKKGGFLTVEELEHHVSERLKESKRIRKRKGTHHAA